MKNEVIMMVGLPGSGKSSHVKKYVDQGYLHLSRDKEGGKVISLLPLLEKQIANGGSAVLDCTFVKRSDRQPFIDKCNKFNVPIKCYFMNTKAEDCQINVLNRMWDRHGKIFFDKDDLKEVKEDPNMFPISVIFIMKKALEPPTVAEGFDKVDKVKFIRKNNESYKNKALFLDYDGTLRETSAEGNGMYPVKPSEVVVGPITAKVLKGYQNDGYRLLGVSNQSGIGKGVLTKEDAESCFDETNRQLGIDIEYSYCPHRVPPVSCYCRKPQSGMVVNYINKYEIDVSKSIFVGDMASDKTCATRLGITFIHAGDFFGGK